jgi:hypothetical protein
MPTANPFIGGRWGYFILVYAVSLLVFHLLVKRTRHVVGQRSTRFASVSGQHLLSGSSLVVDYLGVQLAMSLQLFLSQEKIVVQQITYALHTVNRLRPLLFQSRQKPLSAVRIARAECHVGTLERNMLNQVLMSERQR